MIILERGVIAVSGALSARLDVSNVRGIRCDRIEANRNARGVVADEEKSIQVRCPVRVGWVCLHALEKPGKLTEHDS